MKASDSALSGDTLDRLLAALDVDRDRAGQAYVLLRQKLSGFFQWRGAPLPEEGADKTLTVAAKRIADGEQVRDVSRYCLGIARLILLEQSRTRDRFSPLEFEPPAPEAANPGVDHARMDALEQCLGELPADHRELILNYYADDGRTHIDRRKALARQLGIAPNALRIRAHRIRARLEESVRQLTEEVEGADDMKSGRGALTDRGSTRLGKPGSVRHHHE